MPTERLQRLAFRTTEGDAYYARNRAAHADLARAAARDPLLCAVRQAGLAPRRALEIGASDGWRLAALQGLHPGLECVGLEPSAAAVAAGRALHTGVTLVEGTAESLPFADARFDLVLFGFCLYLCDRADLFRIAAEADRVLAHGGVVGIYDFYAERPYQNPYAHRAELASYKMDYARLFDWNPAYVTLQRRVFPHPDAEGREPEVYGADDLVSVSLLQRDVERAWQPGSEDGTLIRGDGAGDVR